MKKLTVNEFVRIDELIRQWIFDNTRKLTMWDVKDRVFRETINSEYYWPVSDWKQAEINALSAYLISCETEMIIPRSGC